MIRIARYRLDFTVETPLSLPAFAGSTLRGALGHALRAGACVTGAPQCDDCPLLASCAYAQIFEPRPPTPAHPLQDFNQIPRPYVLEPPEWGERRYAPGDRLSFHLVLAGHALDRLALILWALDGAFRRGVGHGNGTARLSALWLVSPQGARQLADRAAGPIAAHAVDAPAVPDSTGQRVTLDFHAPLRLQTNGRRASADELTPRKLLMSLIRRTALMCEFHGDGPLPIDFSALAARADTLGSHKSLRWRDWSRYSSRQQKRMDLGGVMGRWTLEGELEPFLPFLHLGQWLHLGKETVFGLGAYTLETHP